jgi:hypothetical protein
MTKDGDQQKEASAASPVSLPMLNKFTNSTYDFLYQVQPVHLILFASMPLCLGAFAGYRVEMNRIASAAASASADHYNPGSTFSGGGLLRRVLGEEMKNHSPSTKEVASKATATAAESLQLKQIKLDVGRVAFKALGLGSMLSIGGVGILTAGIFKLSGCGSLQEMIHSSREWTPRKRRELEEFLGIEPKSSKHEDVLATKGMTEDEEWEFIKKKYIPELVDDDEQKDNDK